MLDDFGRLGRAWRETDEAGASRTTLVRNLLEGQYENPVRIVAFNTAEGWSRDVTPQISGINRGMSARPQKITLVEMRANPACAGRTAATYSAFPFG